MINFFLSLVLTGLLLCTPSLGAQSLELGKPAPHFRLTDQFGKTWDLGDLKNEVVVVVAANRQSGRTMGPWVENLKKDYGNRIRVLGLVHVSGVPGFARGIARSKIRKETSDPVMVDFSGTTAKDYQVCNDYPVVVVIDRNTIVRNVQKTEYNAKAYKSVRESVENALKRNDSSDQDSDKNAKTKG